MNMITNDKRTDATRLNHIQFTRRKMTMHAMSVEGAGSILPGAKCSSTASKRTRLLIFCFDTNSSHLTFAVRK